MYVLGSLNNSAGANDDIAQFIWRWEVQHGSLTRCNTRKRLVEGQDHRIGIAVDFGVAGYDGSVRAYLHVTVEFAIHGWVQILQPIGADAGDLQILAGAHGYRAGLCINAGDIAWTAIGSWGLDVQALALADGVVPGAVVLAQFRAILVDNHARSHADAGTQEGLGVAIRDKADVIRIWLGGGGKSVALSFFANLWLRSITNWEVAVGQLFGGNYAKNIRLVLVLVQGATHVAIFVQGGVVAGGYSIEAQRQALAQKCSELNLLIAAQTRVRGFTTGVGINEVRDNGLFEFLGEVPHIKWDA